ncbi:uncharacterized protein LOC110729356 [Chenopodium quinoa]|uniref:uncharacterized protein LOC110729356 n=1 Tax=Chenopodium quinoa TaxID=63459 RepID=UPI000B773298|nr:uncharacterized protein LOC110729356 [Chenopodium quinoa]
MAVDVFSENFVGMISPRLSFSRDLDENDTSSTNINDYSCKLDRSFVDSAFDFAFNVDTSITFQSSSADELFSDGKIIPTCLRNEEEVKKSEAVVERVPVIPCLDLQSATITDTGKKSLKEFLEDSIEEEEEEDVNNAAVAAKSFWKFRRSNSLNCDRNQRKGLIGSWKILSRSGSTGKFLEKIVEEEKPSNFHSKLLRKFSRNNSLSNCSDNGNVSTSNNKVLIGSTKMLRRSHSTSDHYFSKSDSGLFRRSNSTGSAPNKLKKQQSLKQQQQNVGNGKSSQKGKVKDNISRNSYGYGNNYNNNLRINPVLNLPTTYIPIVSIDLFSFGSLFCNNGTKDRKKKK